MADILQTLRMVGFSDLLCSGCATLYLHIIRLPIITMDQARLMFSRYQDGVKYSSEPRSTWQNTPVCDESRQYQNTPKLHDTSLERAQTAIGSGRERMKIHLANSFSRNEEISILPGYKQIGTSSKQRNSSVPETRNESRQGSNPRLPSPNVNQNPNYSENVNDGNKLTRFAAQSTYKRALDQQIQERNNIRNQENYTLSTPYVPHPMDPRRINSQPVLNVCNTTTPNLDPVVNTGFLPPWFPLEKPQEDNTCLPLPVQQQMNERSPLSPLDEIVLAAQRQQHIFHLQQQQNRCNSATPVVQNLPQMQHGNAPNISYPPALPPFLCTPSPDQPNTSQWYQAASETPSPINYPTPSQGTNISQSNTQFVSSDSTYAQQSLEQTEDSQPLLKLHVSQTAAQRPPEELLKKEYKNQLYAQIEERRRSGDERRAIERLEEERLQRKIEEDRLKMKLDYEEDLKRQKQKEEEARQRQETILRKNEEMRRKVEQERKEERQRRRTIGRSPFVDQEAIGASVPRKDCGDSTSIEPVTDCSVTSINASGDYNSANETTVISEFKLSTKFPRNEFDYTAPLPTYTDIHTTPIKVSASKSASLLSNLKKLLLDEAVRMEGVIGQRKAVRRK